MLIERQRGLCIGAAVVQVARVCWFVEKAYGRIRDSVLACYSTGGLSTVLLAILWLVVLWCGRVEGVDGGKEIV